MAKLLERRARCKEKHNNGNGFGLTLGQWCAVNGVVATTEWVEALMGVSRGLDRSRLKALGNALVPDVAEFVGRLLVAAK